MILDELNENAAAMALIKTFDASEKGARGKFIAAAVKQGMKASTASAYWQRNKKHATGSGSGEPETPTGKYQGLPYIQSTLSKKDSIKLSPEENGKLRLASTHFRAFLPKLARVGVAVNEYGIGSTFSGNSGSFSIVVSKQGRVTLVDPTGDVTRITRNPDEMIRVLSNLAHLIDSDVISQTHRRIAFKINSRLNKMIGSDDTDVPEPEIKPEVVVKPDVSVDKVDMTDLIKTIDPNEKGARGKFIAAAVKGGQKATTAGAFWQRKKSIAGTNITDIVGDNDQIEVKPVRKEAVEPVVVADDPIVNTTLGKLEAIIRKITGDTESPAELSSSRGWAMYVRASDVSMSVRMNDAPEGNDPLSPVLYIRIGGMNFQRKNDTLEKFEKWLTTRWKKEIGVELARETARGAGDVFTAFLNSKPQPGDVVAEVERLSQTDWANDPNLSFYMNGIITSASTYLKVDAVRGDTIENFKWRVNTRHIYENYEPTNLDAMHKWFPDANTDPFVPVGRIVEVMKALGASSMNHTELELMGRSLREEPDWGMEDVYDWLYFAADIVPNRDHDITIDDVRFITKSQKTGFDDSYHKFMDEMLDNSKISVQDAVKKVDETFDASDPEAARALQQIVNPKGEMVKLTKLSGGRVPIGRFIKDGGRAYHQNLGQESIISVGSRIDKTTLWHEVGHAFEIRHPAVLKMAQAYLISRLGKQRHVKPNKEGRQFQSMAVLTGNSNYGNDEVAIDDHFFDEYIGKIYNPSYSTIDTYPFVVYAEAVNVIRRTQATEVISMGMQYFHNVTSAKDLMTKDPQLFTLIIKVMEIYNG